MAISPQHLEKSFTEEVDKLEQKIDGMLSSQKIYKGQTLSVSSPYNLTSSHFTVLKNRYLTAGWTDVILRSDQRDGEWLEFKY